MSELQKQVVTSEPMLDPYSVIREKTTYAL